ncbi:uncharacterized protein [Haliotis cracherodii]|uniref:uncharacterized protein n=1 Tax=Haliotis cracherodii TaxID=6455 RepID=UPI0039E86D29
MEVVFLSMLLVFVTNAADAGRFQECPEDWTPVNAKCYKFVNERVHRHRASRRCRGGYSASLAVIENEEENEVVQDLIQSHRYAWIALQRGRGDYKWNWEVEIPFVYSNWKDSTDVNSEGCAVILINGYWSSASCRIYSPYVCSKKADCEPGWTGDKCDHKCHCFKGHVCNATHTCPDGCEKGWAGERCARQQEKPTVSFYCMKQRGGYALMASFDQKGIFFSNIGAVNADGEISPTCNYDKSYMMRHGEAPLNVQIQNVSGVLESDCPAQTVGNGILKWTFRLQKEDGVLSFEDEELHLQCDLSEADAVYDDTERIEMGEIKERSLTAATQTRVRVRTNLANPETMEAVTNPSLGDPVSLVATLQEGDDLVNPVFYLWSCQAASPDGKVTVQLTDDSGCSLRKGIGFGTMDKASGVIQSKIFPMFQLPGYTELVFSCVLVPSPFPKYKTQYCPLRE